VFKGLTILDLKLEVFWSVTLSQLENAYRRLKESSFLAAWPWR